MGRGCSVRCRGCILRCRLCRRGTQTFHKIFANTSRRSFRRQCCHFSAVGTFASATRQFVLIAGGASLYSRPPPLPPRLALAPGLFLAWVPRGEGVDSVLQCRQIREFSCTPRTIEHVSQVTAAKK